MIAKIISKLLRQTADDLDEGKYTCSEEEQLRVLETLNSFNQNRELSKEDACTYLNLSRSTFDTYVRCGWIPRGKKKRGFKELSWSKYDLDIACVKIKEITGGFIKNN